MTYLTRWKMKFETGEWVRITRRRLDGPDLECLGKVVEASRDSVTAEALLQGRMIRFTMSSDTEGLVWFSLMTQKDWADRRRFVRS
jgi:hypothetical protein